MIITAAVLSLTVAVRPVRASRAAEPPVGADLRPVVTAALVAGLLAVYGFAMPVGAVPAYLVARTSLRTLVRVLTGSRGRLVTAAASSILVGVLALHLLIAASWGIPWHQHQTLPPAHQPGHAYPLFPPLQSRPKRIGGT